MTGLRAALWILIAACGSTSPAPAPPAVPPPADAMPVDASLPVDAAPPEAPTADPFAPFLVDSPLATPADLACKADRDCVIVYDCCGCSGGGTGAVVNRRRAASVRARVRKDCPKSHVCVAVVSDHPTCIPMNKPACVNHVCGLQPVPAP